MSADHAGFEIAMQSQRERARAAWKGSGETAVGEVYARIAGDLDCEFIGYDTLEADSRVAALLIDGAFAEEASEGQSVEIVVPTTPFYAESGG